MSLSSQVVLLAQKCAQMDKANATAAATAQSRADAAYSLAESAASTAASAYHYEGTVATFAELPNNLTADDKGTVYNVGSDLDGLNYAWNGTSWDSLGKVFTVATGVTSDASTALVPEGVVKTALDAKADNTDLGNASEDFVSAYTTAYAAAGA